MNIFRAFDCDGAPAAVLAGFPALQEVHEVRAPPATAGHAAFAVLLLAGLAARLPVLWTGPAPCLYPPGLAWLGLDPARLLFAQARNDAECLGALEVALRGGMAGVAEAENLPRLAARRLALAAKQGGGIGFLLRHAARRTPLDSTAPATRWLVAPAPSAAAPGAPERLRLRAELLYAKGSPPGTFFFEYQGDEDHGSAPPALALVRATATPAGHHATGRHATGRRAGGRRTG